MHDSQLETPLLPSWRKTWAQRFLILAVTAGGSLGLMAIAGYYSQQCQCRYTPVVFAERAGLKPFQLTMQVDVAEREAFATMMESAGAVIDPDWKLGEEKSSFSVYAKRDRWNELRILAETWRP